MCRLYANSTPLCGASQVAQWVKNPPAMQELWVRSIGWEEPLEEGMATHSSILPWRIPWTEEPGGLQPVGSQRVRHDWVSTHARTPLHIRDLSILAFDIRELVLEPIPCRYCIMVINLPIQAFKCLKRTQNKLCVCVKYIYIVFREI